MNYKCYLLYIAWFYLISCLQNDGINSGNLPIVISVCECVYAKSHIHRPRPNHARL